MMVRDLCVYVKQSVSNEAQFSPPKLPDGIESTIEFANSQSDCQKNSRSTNSSSPFRASKDKNHELSYWGNRALLPTVAVKMPMHFSLAAPIQNDNNITMLLKYEL